MMYHDVKNTNERGGHTVLKGLIIDHEAGEIIRSVACVRPSVRPSVRSSVSRCHFSTGAEWSILVLGFDKYSKRSSETQVSYTLKKHHRVLISRSIANG